MGDLLIYVPTLPRGPSTKYKAQSTISNFCSSHQSKLLDWAAEGGLGGNENDHNPLKHIDDVFRNVDSVSIDKDSTAQQNRKQYCRQKHTDRMIATQ